MPILFNNVRVAPSMDFGTGGMPFMHHAPNSGFALVGFALRVGDWIDQITPIYAELSDDAQIGPELYGPSFGGHGGQPIELRVQPGHVAVGIQTRSGNFLDGVRIAQARWTGALLAEEPTWTRWVTGGHRGGVERQERIAEPFGRAVVIGVSGRSGHYVDNLTIVTAEPLRIAAAAAAPTTSTGRGKTQPALG